MLRGSIVAIATPMANDGSLDLDAYRRLIDFHLREGTQGIVAVGTTGESPTVDFDEHCLLIRTAVEHVAGRVPVIAGTGGNSTREAMELQRFAREVGADMALSVVPYYNKPTQEGLFRHFEAIAGCTDLPTILYNVPGRTVADLHNDTVVRLSAVPNIIGIKDATGNLERAADLLHRVPPDFALYSGDDGTGLAFMLMGGHGVISVTANVAPRHVRRRACREPRGSPRDQQRIDGLAQDPVRRGQPDTGQMGAGRDGAHRARHTPATDPVGGTVP